MRAASLPPRIALRWFLIALFASVAAVLEVRGGRDCLYELLATKWPTAPGVVTISHMESRGSGRSYRQVAAITHSYVVGGERLYSDRVAFGQEMLGGFSSAERMLARYPENSNVTVSFDRADPQTAVLEPGEFFPGLSEMAMGLLVIGAIWWAVTKRP